MPLRDHFRPPVEARHSWDELHGMWPAMIVRQLFPLLPEGYVAAPGVHLGAAFEIDVSAYERDEPTPSRLSTESGGRAVAPRPTLTIETELSDEDEYEVRVYDQRHGRRLVAAIELISPSNKDRPESRRAFVAKVAALLRRDVCVSLIDVVTIRSFNLHAELLDFIGRGDLAEARTSSPVYVATLRVGQRVGHRSMLDSWFYPMRIGESLPTLPIWLNADLSIPLELEASYEETCRFLRIT